MQKIKISFLVLLGFFLLSACNTQPNSDSTSTTTSSTTATSEAPATETATITLMKGDKTFDEKTVHFAEGASLLKVLKANFKVEEVNDFILSIDELEQDEKNNYYWIFAVNDHTVTTGAGETILKDGDQVTFTYEEFK